jgi:hypothetical protein
MASGKEEIKLNEKNSVSSISLKFKNSGEIRKISDGKTYSHNNDVIHLQIFALKFVIILIKVILILK